VPDVPIFLGGATIMSDAQARRIGADTWTGSGTNAAVETVERLTGPPVGRAQRRVA
jgi:hypothetical protein